MTGFPQYPPGLWRRIVLFPQPNWIGAALEDDMHRFHLRIDHADGTITALRGDAVRHPWSECPGAIGHLAGDVIGKRLAEVARLDPRHQCTHFHDLAVLAAGHAGDATPSIYDMYVADRVDGRTTATIELNGAEQLCWELADSRIESGPRAGLDLRQLSKWKQDLPPEEAEQATLLRRAIFVSGARQYVPETDFAAENKTARAGVCFNYQSPQIERSTRTPDWHVDHSRPGGQPLDGFDPASAFTAMAA